MPLISVTRLRIRTPRFLPGFAWHTWRSTRQAQQSPGFLGGQLAADAPRRTFWTITAWLDEEAMRTYRIAGAHKRAMPKLLDWCDEAAVVHWQQDSAQLPAAAEALRRMLTEGRTSKLRHPSLAHGAGNTAPDGKPPAVGLPLQPRVNAF